MQQLVTRASTRRYTLPPIHSGLGRLGASPTPAQTVQQVGSIATPVISAAAAPAVASILAGSSAVTASTLALAGGLVTVAFAGVLMGIEAILNSGCGQTCVVTSQWANQAEPLLLQNIQTYFNLPTRTTLDQQSALNVFDAVWGGLVQRCSQQGLGTAGQNCIADRQRGACKWKQTSTSPLLKFPGEPQPGECWNWFSGYRDPIANDPNVSPAPVTPVVSSSTDALVSGFGSSDLFLLAGAALLLMGAAS